MRKRFLAMALSLAMTLSLCAVSSNGVNAEEINDEAVIETVEESVDEEVDAMIDESDADSEDETGESDTASEDETDEANSVVVDEVTEEVYGENDLIQFTSTNFPDEIFRNYLKTNYNGKTYGDVTKLELRSQSIASFKGIELFTKLDYFYCNSDTAISSLDLTGNKELTFVSVTSNSNLASINVNGLTKLRTLYLSSNKLSSIDVSTNLELRELQLGFNSNLSTVDTTMLKHLVDLRLDFTNVKSIDLSKNKMLKVFGYGRYIEKVDLRNLSVRYLSIPTDLSNINIKDIYINKGTKLGLNTYDKFTGVSSSNTSIVSVGTEDGYWGAGDIVDCITALKVGECKVTLTDKNKNTVTFTVHVAEEIDNFPESIFPDPVFRNYLKSDFGNSSYEDILSINIENLNIKSIKGIEKLTNIEEIKARNVQLESVDLSKNIALKVFDNDDNCSIKAIDFSNNKNLVKVRVVSCENLSKINVTGCTKLEELVASFTDIDEIDLSTNYKLKEFYCVYTYIENLDLSNCTELERLNAYASELKYVDITNCTKLKSIDVSGNSIKESDLTIYPNLVCYKILGGWDKYDVIYLKKGTSIAIGAQDSAVSSNTSVVSLSTRNDIYAGNNSVVLNALKEGTSNLTLSTEYGTHTFKLVVGNPPKEIKVKSIDIQKSDATGVSGKIVAENVPTDGQYRIIYSNDNGASWKVGSDWSQSSSFSFKPEGFNQFIFVAEVRASGDDSTKKQFFLNTEYHPIIKGNCQMPYAMIAPGEPGYLIGLETYSGTAYSVEMLILDCTSMQWTYSTGQNLVPENMLWTVWQPQYGYYWTLFRAYDKNGNLIDEVCYGFVNAY